MRAAKHRVVAAGLLVCLAPALAAAQTQPVPTPPPPYGPPPPAPQPAAQPAPPVPYDHEARREKQRGTGKVMMWGGIGLALAGTGLMVASFVYWNIAVDRTREIEDRFRGDGSGGVWDAGAQAIENEGLRAERRAAYCLGGGAVLMMAGSLLITVGARAVKRDKEMTLTVAPSDGGALLGWGGSF